MVFFLFVHFLLLDLEIFTKVYPFYLFPNRPSKRPEKA